MRTTNHICGNRPLLEIPARRSSKPRERGVALIMTIFGLLLLTAITAAMMYSSNSETLISVNYRDKQVASYAALSALQEARNRIQPVAGDLALKGYLPTKTPDAGGYVLYIINPNPLYNETANTIAPWNPASPYFDQELCQEGMLGLARGTAGVACSGGAAVPAGGCADVTAGAVAGWCGYYDNSANATAWSLGGVPLDYKWVRISLKEDWNTAVYVPNAATAAGKQVCWDGNYQNQIPGGYTSNCLPTSGNSVIGVNLLSAGSGFTSAPTVTIAGGGGSGATATAQIGSSGGGTISSATVSPQGSGYTSPPTVAFSGVTDGSGATFKAIINGAAITGITANNAGTNYCYGPASPPTVNVSTANPGDTLSNATATVTMKSSGCIASITPSGNCSSMKNKTAAIGSSGPLGSGSGFSGTAVFDSSGSVSNVTISSVGSGYTGGTNTVVISKNCSITPTFNIGQQVQSISLSNGGNYMNTPTAALNGSVTAPQTPVLPTVAAQWPGVNSPVTAIQIASAGTGYLQPSYPLTICSSGGNCTAGGAANTGAVSQITAINLTAGGQNYSSNPTVTITGGGGSGGSASATIGAGNNNTPMGPIYIMTSFASTRNGRGAKSMAQMEAGVRPPFTFNLGGPLTLAGPLGLAGANPVFPNSNNFVINGYDANSCGQTPTNKPAIGVYDSQSQQIVNNALGKPQNYLGPGGTPSIENVYTQIGGDTLTPTALWGMLKNLSQYETTPTLPAVPGTVTTSLPSTTVGSITVVDGDLTLSGNTSGSGILIVTGNMTWGGTFTWNGLVLIIGNGQITHNGGGNGVINGSMYIAQIQPTQAAPAPPTPPLLSQANPNLLPTMGPPSYTWNGGGGNSIHYDHCLADGLLQKYNGQPSPLPLQVLSSRVLTF